VKKHILFFFITLFSVSYISAEILHIGFDNLDGWRNIRFISTDRESSFSTGQLGEDYVLEIQSHDAISGIVYEEIIDLEQTPIIEWRWRVTDFPGGADQRSKDTDDSALRLYIMFEYKDGKIPLSDRLKFGLVKLLYDEFPPKAVLGFVSTENPFPMPVLQSSINNRTRYVEMKAYATNCDSAAPMGLSGTPWCTAQANIAAVATDAFGELPSNRARVALIGDSDSTNDSTLGYLDYIEVKVR